MSGPWEDFAPQSAQQDAPPWMDYAPAPAAKSVPVTAGAVAEQATEGVPFISKPLSHFKAAVDAAATGIAKATGLDAVDRKLGLKDQNSQAGDFLTREAENFAHQQDANKQFEEAHPNISTAARIGGGIAGTVPLVALAPAAFGIGGASLPISMLRGAASTAALSGADAAVRGQDPVKAALWGAGGGAAGPLAGKVVGSAFENLANSSAASRGATNDLAAAAERQGVDFPRVAATDSLVTQRAGAALKEIPLIGDPLVKASRRANEQMGEALTRAKQGYGSSSTYNAGDVVKSGLVDWITGRSKAVTDRLYGSVDGLVDPAVTRPLDATRNMVGTIAAERQQAAQPGTGRAIDMVLDAVQRPNGLNYQGVKTLRTSIGEMLDSSILPADISRTELKRVYGALTDDLRGTVQAAGGPDAIKAFERANTVNQIVAQRREALAKIVGTEAEAAPERVVDRLVSMASGGSRADIQKLLLARKTVGVQNWDEVASAAISRIGRDAQGNFSPDRFLTAFGRLSPNGKAMLFGSTGKSDLVQALDDIAKQPRHRGSPRAGAELGSLSGLAGTYARLNREHEARTGCCSAFNSVASHP